MKEGETEVPTIPLSEVESWYKEHIRAYQARIDTLEKAEKIKDSQIHSLQLALATIRTLLATASPQKRSPHKTRHQKSVTQSAIQIPTFSPAKEKLNSEEDFENQVKFIVFKSIEKSLADQLVEKSVNNTPEKSVTNKSDKSHTKPKKEYTNQDEEVMKVRTKLKNEAKGQAIYSTPIRFPLKKAMDKKEELNVDNEDNKPETKPGDAQLITDTVPFASKKESENKKEEFHRISSIECLTQKSNLLKPSESIKQNKTVKNEENNSLITKISAEFKNKGIQYPIISSWSTHNIEEKQAEQLIQIHFEANKSVNINKDQKTTEISPTKKNEKYTNITPKKILSSHSFDPATQNSYEDSA